MSNYGLGIGSFMEGLTKGVDVRRKLDNDKFEREVTQKKLDLMANQDQRAASAQTFDQDMRGKDFSLRQGQDARAAARDDFTLTKGKSDQAYIETERAADAPINAAKRKSVLTAFSDADEQRTKLRTAGAESDKAYADKKAASVKAETGADGSKTFSMDGKAYASEQEANAAFEQRHGTAMDQYRKVVVPQMERAKVEAGDLAGAQAWQKWNELESTRKATDSIGRAQSYITMGDWDKAGEHIKSVMNNKDYMGFDGYEPSISPIKNKDGKTEGFSVGYKNNETGETYKKDYKDIAKFGEDVIGFANPISMFETTRKQLEAKRASEVKMAEENHKTANQITLERAKQEGQIDQKRVESALKIAEDRAKGGGLGVSREQYAKGVVDMHQKLRDANVFRKKGVGADGKSVEMPLDEQMALADAKYRELLARAGTPSSMAPAQMRRPVLMSRPGAAVAATPAAPAAASADDE